MKVKSRPDEISEDVFKDLLERVDEDYKEEEEKKFVREERSQWE